MYTFKRIIILISGCIFFFIAKMLYAQAARTPFVAQVPLRIGASINVTCADEAPLKHAAADFVLEKTGSNIAHEVLFEKPVEFGTGVMVYKGQGEKIYLALAYRTKGFGGIDLSDAEISPPAVDTAILTHPQMQQFLLRSIHEVIDKCKGAGCRSVSCTLGSHNPYEDIFKNIGFEPTEKPEIFRLILQR